MASANISFYFVTGAEIHWHQAHSMRMDAAAVRTLLSGLTGFLVVELILIVAAWFLRNYLHDGVGVVLEILGNSMKSVMCCWRRNPRPAPQTYERIECENYHDDNDDNHSEQFLLEEGGGAVDPSEKTAISLLKRLLVLLPTTVILVLRCVRPPDPAFFFLSWSIPLAPFVDGRHHRGPPVEVSGLKGDYGWLTNQTALSPPPAFDWLPPTVTLPGFEDWSWHANKNTTRPQLHYNATQDPLHISNLHEDILKPLREPLANGDINIKHIIFLKLESTRADVFPLREEGYVWQRIQESYKHSVPDDVQERLLKMTHTAERLTGFPSALSKKKGNTPKPYGGLSARNGYTAGTYTLKSVIGSVCGVSPLVADFNQEYKQHIYQPCLAHVLSALNPLSNTTVANTTDDYTTWPWRNMWMQSVTQSYDNQDALTPLLGYDDIVDKEKLDRPDAKHNDTKTEEVNYYGYPDTVLRQYVREAIDDAEENHRRLFLTHLTGITHHPWGMPNGKYEELLGQGWHNDNMNHYLNTIGFADGWLSDILDILEEKGVANETLLVMAGDQ